MWHGDWNGADWAWMSLMMLLFWAVLIGGIVWVARARRRPDDDTSRADGSGLPGRSTARDILDERYARGELSDEEYRARRDVLSGR